MSTQAGAVAFRLREVGFCYKRGKPDILSLPRTELVIPAGMTTAVLGLSGSGKTTLLNLLGLLCEKGLSRGTIRYRDGPGQREYERLSWGQRAELRCRHFGFVLQSAYLLPHFTCLQNVEVPLALAGLPPRQRRAWVRTLLHRAGGDTLARLADRSAREISGGEKQRMAVLRAVSHDPDVVFADEPFSNLDPVNSRLVIDLLRSWRAGDLHDKPFGEAPGADDPNDRQLVEELLRTLRARSANEEGTPRQRTLILVSHNYAVAHRFADWFLLLKQGEVVDGRLLHQSELSPEKIELLLCADRCVEETHNPV